MSDQQNPVLRSLEEDIRDGENNPVPFDVAYKTGDHSIEEICAAVRQVHGEEHFLLPLSACSCGDQLLSRPAPDSGPVIGIQISPVANPEIRIAKNIALQDVGLEEIVIDRLSRHIYAGAAITLGQLGEALGENVGSNFKVLGADLTSYSYAQVGATFMTGGMGPQRRYFSDSVDQAMLFDGDNTILIDGEELHGYAGTYGWTGIVSAVRCRYVELPQHELAFAIPLNNSPEDLAAMVRHLGPWCFLDTTAAVTRSVAKGPNLILGIEHITVDSMQPMLALGMDNSVTASARRLMKKCQAASSDGVVFVSAMTDNEADEFLLSLLDDASVDDPTIAGTPLEHTEFYSNPEAMRELREAVPQAARTQAPSGNFVYKNHTDATVRLNQEYIHVGMESLWRINLRYVETLRQSLAALPGVDGQVLVYGHMNPYGVDPHNRVTIAAENEPDFRQAVETAQIHRARFYHELSELGSGPHGELIGGEKGAGSEADIIEAISDCGTEDTPDRLMRKYRCQLKRIQSSSSRLNWRAVTPYRSQSMLPESPEMKT